MGNPGKSIFAAIAAAAVLFATSAVAQETKHYRFAHDQQLNSGYSIAYDIFSAKLKELSKGKQHPVTARPTSIRSFPLSKP